MAKQEIKQSSSQRLFEGEVVSDKMDKTIVVKVRRIFTHSLLGKTMRRFKKYKAHDEENMAKIGDWVEVAQCRPLSKTKNMVLKRVVRRSR